MVCLIGLCSTAQAQIQFYADLTPPRVIGSGGPPEKLENSGYLPA